MVESASAGLWSAGILARMSAKREQNELAAQALRAEMPALHED
jgi:hypothetical protein